MKLSKAQHLVVILMKGGWDLIQHHGVGTWCNLKLVSDGTPKIKKVSIATISSLLRGGVIKRDDQKSDWRSTFYILTEKAK